jgi:hypothetical protein
MVAVLRNLKVALLVWGSLLLLVLFELFINKNVGAAFVWVLQLLLILFVSALAVLPTWFCRSVFVGALVVLALLGLLDRRQSLQGWRTSEETVFNLADLSGVTTFAARDGLAAGTKAWLLAENSGDLTFSFEARKVSGLTGWAWLRRGEPSQLAPVIKGEQLVTHWQAAPDATLFRRYELQEALGSRKFRLLLTANSEGPEHCGRIRLATAGGEARLMNDLCLSLDPKVVSVDWQVPAGVQSSSIVVTLEKFTKALELRTVTLQELTRDLPESILAEPTGVFVGLRLEGQKNDPRLGVRFMPNETWQGFSVRVSEETLQGSRRLESYLQLEEGVMVELRNVLLTSDSGVSPRPLPLRTTFSFLNYHPNVLGHGAATLALTTVLLSGSWWSALALASSAAVAVLTQSRTAFWTLALAFVLLAWQAKKARGLLLVVVAILLLAFYVVVPLRQMLNFESVGVSRPEIWEVAWEAFLTHPWLGLQGQSFLDYAAGQTSALQTISHAHNLWLQLAAQYGVVGIICGLWLTVGLLVVAWRWGEARGLLFIGAVLLLNTFDVSLFTIGCLVPTLVGLYKLEMKYSEARR